MTTKRNKGSTSLDLALPVAPYYQTDPQVLKDVEIMRTNATSRWAKDNQSRTLSRFHTANDNSSKMATLSQSKIEILRANSPTLKRLVAARIKLERYSNTISRTISNSRQSIRSMRETPYPKIHDKQFSTALEPVHVPPQPAPPPPPPPPRKQIQPQSNLADKPLDKITYEKTWSVNGNMKQKCSLEIWLPKPSLDNDDESNTNRTLTPEVNTIEKKPQPIPTIKSRRSSVVKITATTTVTNIETKSVDEVISKKSEPVVIPRVYHYGDYIIDLPDERPRSSKSVTTVKSDSAASIKSIRRQHTRAHTRRQSVSTHHSEEILRFHTIEVPTSAKTVSINRKLASPTREIKSAAKPTNPIMINDLMQKYSLIKKNHQELTQMKIQLEKTNNDLKNNSIIIIDRPPPIPESTLLVSPDHPTVSVKKLLLDSSPIRSITEQSNPSPKLLDRRSTPRKPSHSDIYPHLRIFSLANQRQHRQSSATVPAALLPNVSGRKTDETARILQRSKTLDVVLDIPNSVNVKSRIGTAEQSHSRISKRSALTLRSEKQHIHHSTTIPTNTILIHFNQANLERNYFVPE